MIKERRLSMTEAALGLSLIAGLLVALGAAYVYRLDERPPVTPPIPNWESTPPVEQTAYRPEWLPPQDDRPRTLAR